MRSPRTYKGGGAGAAALLIAAACSGSIGNGAGGEDVPDPGRVTLRRLNQVEYNNTVRDLLGTELTPADDFPTDDRGYGFDNIGDVLSLSPAHADLYAQAAARLIDDTLGGGPAAPASQRFEIETIGASAGDVSGEGWNLWSNGEATAPVEVTAAGTYRLSARAYGQQAGDEPARMSLGVSGVAPVVIDVTATAAAPQVYETNVQLTPGQKVLTVGFVNDFYDEAAMLDRNLWVDWVEISGPLEAQPVDPVRRASILVCDPAGGDACVRDILARFARRAWRRPPTDAEVDGLAKIVSDTVGRGNDVETGLRLALRTVLVSPHFIFRVEIDPDPASIAPHRLTDHELAARLSYFLWSSMPDDELAALADEGKLHDPEVLRAQAERMLADPKARALTDNFAGQWLFVRALADHEVDPATYPAFDDALAADMREETELLFAELLGNDRPIHDLLTADFTFVNDRLAAHYGLPPPGTSEHVMVSLAGTPRRGVLTQGTLLTVNSYPKRTSPVKRGKWVLENLLCSPPPPPPPGVDGLPDGVDATGSIRDRLEAHRENEVCASCHTVMDPIGFGLDHFDGVGAYRDMDEGYPIDATGEIAGITFDGAVEMAQIIADDPRFPRCVVERLWIYANGRGPEAADAQAAITTLDGQFAEAGYRLHDLVIDVILHPSFRYRRGEP
jgi:hypothetical protein